MSDLDAIFKRVRCSIHHGQKLNYLTLDPKNFQIICSLCQAEGLKSKKKNLIIVDPGLSNAEQSIEKDKEEIPANEDSDHFCYKHTNEPSLFYCEECGKFICKTCFATEHRYHSSSTFELISDVIKNKINSLYEELENLDKTLDENGKELEDNHNYFEDTKKNFKTNLENINSHITKALEDKANEYNNQIESFFNGVDKEVESNLKKLESKRTKSNNMLEEFQKMQNEINNIQKDQNICLFKKEKDNIIKENKQFLLDIEAFLKEQLSQTKEKVSKEEENFKEKCENLKKNIDLYESSVITTIKSGIPNVCSRVRRFCKYSIEKTKYFKTDSLCIKVSQSVNLTGFALCGLIHEHEQPITTYKVNLKLFELADGKIFDKNSKEMFSLDVEIPSITNYVDPVYQFYLENSIFLNKDKLYLVILNNLSDQIYVNTWTGSTTRDKTDIENQTSIVISNTSNIKFDFSKDVEIESDFNEFSSGIVSDIIYSLIE